jgi:hypothetical protein
MSNESGAQLPKLRDLAHHNTGDGSVATAWKHWWKKQHE